MECLDEATVLAHCGGSLPAEVSARVRRHLTTCEECLAVVRTFARASSPALDDVAPTPAPAPLPTSGTRPSWQPTRGDILVGKYVVERVVPSNEGVVTALAREAQTDRDVAVAILARSPRVAPGESERFLRSARRAVRIRSDKAERIMDTGRLEDGAPYVVRERVGGLSAAAVVAAGGPLSEERAVDLVLEAAEAVAEAHTHGVAHGALGPTTIFVELLDGEERRVRVRGFGRPLAPDFDEASQRADVEALRGVLAALRGADEGASETDSVLSFARSIAWRGTDVGRAAVERIAELVARHGADLSVPPPRDRAAAYAVPRAPRVPADAADVTATPSPLPNAERAVTTRRFGVVLLVAALLAVVAAYGVTRLFPDLGGP